MGKMKYIIEKEYIIPLCAVLDDNYINYNTGEIITDLNSITFIEKMLKRKTVTIQNINFEIYKIVDKNNEIKYYNYQINGTSNFLDNNKRVLDDIGRQFVIDKILNNEYKQIKIWGDINE